MTKAAWIGLIALSGSLVLAAGSASEQDRVRELAGTGAIVPLEEILGDARLRHPTAHVLEAELESKGESHYYEIELVDDAGVVRELKYDAVTGELLDEDVND
ncbi:MAG: peptidase [Gammaproteobacteria bacterium]|jgi:uncharacterized membrane protein YkoI|nr:peptidase [Gammaproteobacteria bacterium]